MLALITLNTLLPSEVKILNENYIYRLIDNNGNMDSSVGIATGHGLDDQSSRFASR